MIKQLQEDFISRGKTFYISAKYGEELLRKLRKKLKVGEEEQKKIKKQKQNIVKNVIIVMI